MLGVNVKPHEIRGAATLSIYPCSSQSRSHEKNHTVMPRNAAETLSGMVVSGERALFSSVIHASDELSRFGIRIMQIALAKVRDCVVCPCFILKRLVD